MYIIKINGMLHASVTNKLAALCEAANLHNTLRSDIITLEDKATAINFNQIKTTNDIFKCLFEHIKTYEIIARCKAVGFNVTASKVKGWRLSADNIKYRKIAPLELVLVCSLFFEEI